MKIHKHRTLEYEGLVVYFRRTITVTDLGIDTGRWEVYGRTRLAVRGETE